MKEAAVKSVVFAIRKDANQHGVPLMFNGLPYPARYVDGRFSIESGYFIDLKNSAMNIMADCGAIITQHSGPYFQCSKFTTTVNEDVLRKIIAKSDGADTGH